MLNFKKCKCCPLFAIFIVAMDVELSESICSHCIICFVQTTYFPVVHVKVVYFSVGWLCVHKYYSLAWIPVSKINPNDSSPFKSHVFVYPSGWKDPCEMDLTGSDRIQEVYFC